MRKAIGSWGQMYLKSILATSQLVSHPNAVRGPMLQGCENMCHSLTKLRVSTGCLLKLLFFGTQPIVMHGLEHGQLKCLNKYSMPPSMLKMKKFFVEVV